jgi:hypothetical protein
MAAGLSITPAQAAGLDAALSDGKVNVDMRLRYEAVDDNTNQKATAGTLRTRLGYQTGDFQNLFALGEFEAVRSVAGLDEYAPLRSGYATVADPEVTQINQALLGYTGLPDTTIRLGRQRLIIGNARFVGNVGWRQNEQTFDAVSLLNTSLPDTTLTYAFVDKVNGILPAFDADVSDHLLNAAYRGLAAGTVTAYAYLLEDDNSQANNDTYGLRFDGSSALSPDNTLLYTAEFASQSTDTNDASYTLLEGGLQYSGITTKLGYEVLGSDNGAYGFQTPLATKHAFNGWSDEFLATPAAGLQDVMLSVGGKLSGIKLLGVYHDFSSDEGSTDYGTEVDLLAAKKFGNRYTVGLKYASYSADTWKTDTDKLWLWGELKI